MFTVDDMLNIFIFIIVFSLVTIFAIWFLYVLDEWLDKYKKQETYDLEKEIYKVLDRNKKKPKRKKKHGKQILRH